MTPVENEDQVRVTRLERRTEYLADEVATFGGVLTTHMSQVAADKIEDKLADDTRHSAMTAKIDDTLSAVGDNRTQLGILVAVAEKKEQWFGPMNGKTKVAAYGVGGLGGGWVVFEAVRWAYEKFNGLAP